ncbi:MAG: extracellular solute-binding protein, partial [Nitrospinota bacterium]
MSWRKIVLSLVLVMFLAVPAWAEITLKFYYPVGVAGPLVRVINTMVKKFNDANPGITVVPVYAGNYNQTMQKVQTAVLGGTPPDVAVVEISEVLSLRAMDATIPLDDYIKAEGGEAFLEQFFPAFFGNAKVEGHIYSFPFQRSTPILYWNKDAFREEAAALKKAGLDPNRAPKTWDELVAYAKILTKREDGEVKRYGVII